MTMIVQVCLSYPTFLPLYQMVLPGDDLAFRSALVNAREYLVNLVVVGMLVEQPETKMSGDRS